MQNPTDTEGTLVCPCTSPLQCWSNEPAKYVTADSGMATLAWFPRNPNAFGQANAFPDCIRDYSWPMNYFKVYIDKQHCLRDDIHGECESTSCHYNLPALTLESDILDNKGKRKSPKPETVSPEIDLS